ncbi:MAG: tetratricopeptide repeat protein [Spirochaetales bacterium]|nr:tetratricopeptide repeat protein [Spirochaetales bacterium]
MKKKSKREATKETVIIVGLLCFIAGYAVNGLVGSVNSFSRQPVSAGTGIIQQQTTDDSEGQSQIDILTEQLDKNPKDTTSWINLGNIYFDSDNFDNAIAAYLKALELEPENPDVLSDLGVMYRRSGKSENAITAFDKAFNIDPGHTMSLFNKGIVQFYDLDLKNEALETWKRLGTIDPNFRMPTGELITDFLKTIN